MDLFPNGIFSYLIGGIFIGLGVVVIYLSTGLIAGASTFLDSTLSFFSRLGKLKSYKDSRNWRMVFVLGLMVGAAVYAVLFQQQIWMTDVQWPRLLFGGVLVGIGTRLGKGCTSGHGVCGVASLSNTSIINVITFILLAMGTAQLIQALGVTP